MTFALVILTLAAFTAAPPSATDLNESTRSPADAVSRGEPRSNNGASPASIVLDGTRLAPAAHARRERLLGAIELYEIAVYVDGPMRTSHLVSSDLMKAVRIDVTYIVDLHRRVRFDWQRELIPDLAPEARARLRSAFAPLRRGDHVLIAYVPGRGTTVRINRAVAVFGAHHDLMLAFLDHWIGQRPVSEEIKRTLLAPF